MLFREAKIFKGDSDSLIYVDYDPKNIEYFDLIETQKKQGLNQFIITSDIMIKIIRMFVVERQFSLVSIDFMNEDDDLIEKIEGLIEKIGQNSLFFADLLNELHFLSDEQSIDILKIKLKRRKESKSTQLKIQANGIFFIDNESFKSESKKLVDFIDKNQY